MRKIKIILPLMIISFLQFKCGDETSSSYTQITLTIISGNNQLGYENTLLGEPVIIKATNEKNQPVGSLELDVTVRAGGGTIENESFTTDINGLLEINWRLGAEAQNQISITHGNGEDEIFCSAVARYLYRMPEEISDGWEVDSLDIDQPQIQNLLAALDTIRLEGTTAEIHSFLVVWKNKLVLETYFPGHNSRGELVNFERDTPHEVQSASKSFRSTLIGIAIDKGFIAGVDTKVFSIFPEYSSLNNEQKNEITLEDILTMSSGLDWNEEYDENDSRNTLSAITDFLITNGPAMYYQDPWLMNRDLILFITPVHR